MPENETQYLSIDDLMKGAVDCPEIDQMFEDLAEESSKLIIDPVQLRKRQDWGILAHQVVGGEVD